MSSFLNKIAIVGECVPLRQSERRTEITPSISQSVPWIPTEEVVKEQFSQREENPLKSTEIQHLAEHGLPVDDFFFHAYLPFSTLFSRITVIQTSPSLSLSSFFQSLSSCSHKWQGNYPSKTQISKWYKGTYREVVLKYCLNLCFVKHFCRKRHSIMMQFREEISQTA